MNNTHKHMSSIRTVKALPISFVGCPASSQCREQVLHRAVGAAKPHHAPHRGQKAPHGAEHATAPGTEGTRGHNADHVGASVPHKETQECTQTGVAEASRVDEHCNTTHTLHPRTPPEAQEDGECASDCAEGKGQDELTASGEQEARPEAPRSTPDAPESTGTCGSAFDDACGNAADESGDAADESGDAGESSAGSREAPPPLTETTAAELCDKRTVAELRSLCQTQYH